MKNGSPILLVDDDDNDVLLIQLAFETAGMAGLLHAVPNGYEAIRYLSGDGVYADRTRHPMPSLVLLDLNMPVMTGFHVLEWLRRHPCTPRVVVIILTASSTPADIQRARSLGAADYREKPTNSALLVPMLRELQARWLVGDRISAVAGELPN